MKNLHHGDDWDTMCETTPATVHGIDFEHPTVCEDRVRYLASPNLVSYPEINLAEREDRDMAPPGTLQLLAVVEIDQHPKPRIQVD